MNGGNTLKTIHEWANKCCSEKSSNINSTLCLYIRALYMAFIFFFSVFYSTDIQKRLKLNGYRHWDKINEQRLKRATQTKSPCWFKSEANKWQMGEHWLFSLTKRTTWNFLGVKWKIINVYFVQSVFWGYILFGMWVGGCSAGWVSGYKKWRLEILVTISELGWGNEKFKFWKCLNSKSLKYKSKLNVMRSNRNI